MSDHRRRESHESPVEQRKHAIQQFLRSTTSDPEVAAYRDRGRWRERHIDGDAIAVAEREIGAVETPEKKCYRNVQKILQQTEAVQYVEGVASPGFAPIPIKHAWVELDGAVVDPTWGVDGPQPAKHAVYYGVEIDRSDVFRVLAERETFGPVISELTDAGRGR